MIKEGLAEIEAETPKVVSKRMGIFYNPVMRLNRTLSILLVKSYFDREIRAADPLAGTGIRAIRLIRETGKISSIDVNDHSEKAVELIRENLKHNNIRANIHNKDANIFLLESRGFDYIDVDPFGTPNPFLDSAVKRIARKGVLAVTATDTAALTGTYANACKRKYWARPLRNYLMHEIGIRILARKIQLIGVQYEKALTPVLSYSKDHYYRIFLRCEKGKGKCDEIIKQHNFFQKAGPLWTGMLNSKKLIEKMLRHSDAESTKLLEVLRDESEIEQVGFYSLDRLSKGKTPRIKEVVKRLKENSINAARTHFAEEGIKCEMPEKRFIDILNKKAENSEILKNKKRSY